MDIPLKPDNSALIKDAFEKIQTKDDLLNLLNSVKHIAVNRNQPGIDLLVDFDISEILQTEDNFTKHQKPITEKQLDFFSTSFELKDKKRNRYTRFYIRKKSGKLREIKAPLPKLKEIQRAINVVLQSVYDVQEHAYGFVPGKSIVDNAKVHAGASFVANIDIKDFFPSVHFRRIKLMLEKPPFNLTGEREPLAFLIANLCTENAVLPQGAPTSPLLTNIICQRLDRRLQQLASQYKAAYSRYADDITFSCSEYIFTRRFMLRLEKILKDDRFEINREKTRIQGKAFRQEVTGLTVNEKVNVSRKFYRSYRTLLHLYLNKGAEKAMEYFIRRMPASVALIKKKEKIKDINVYMQNVIWGKYRFLRMVKKDFILPAPFAVDPGRIRLSDGTFFLKSIMLASPENPTAKKSRDVYSLLTDKDVRNIVDEPAMTFDVPTDRIQTNSDQIEKILTVWETDGFKQAIEIIKMQADE
jgi:RNA-directed DNA polymerase